MCTWKGKDQDYPSERRKGIVNQAFDAITRTIWDLDTRPEPYEDPQHPYAVVIDDGDEEDRFDLVDIAHNDLSTLEILLRH